MTRDSRWSPNGRDPERGSGHSPTSGGAEGNRPDPLRRILEHWEMRQELYTSDAECAAGMADIARLAIAQRPSHAQ
jgi:hypothetical protein